MDAKVFFLINFVVVVVLIWRVFAARKPDQPTPMNIGDDDKTPIPDELQRQAARGKGHAAGASGKSQGHAGSGMGSGTQFNDSDNWRDVTAPGAGAKKETQSSRFEPQERSLNCWFQFNGETWDAFEVLGVPAGSTKDACFKALTQAKTRMAKPHDFLDSAWVALEQHFGRVS